MDHDEDTGVGVEVLMSPVLVIQRAGLRIPAADARLRELSLVGERLRGVRVVVLDVQDELVVVAHWPSPGAQ